MTHLKPGDNAPDFVAKDQNGAEIKLSDYAGKKLILYFYPKDNTSGCTAEACNLRDGYEDLAQLGFDVVGVSPDSEASHQKFIKKFGLQFPLVSDVDKNVAQLYGVWGEKKMYGKSYMGINRTTFLIDEGKIVEVFTKVQTNDHVKQILSTLSKK
ncbi:MAG: thioredoxin-dependent thiol peroxidase [Bacteroidales bacterium]|nr:thioredoxin-dependent thiol peroxidase [Bacteroidales bacterium]MBN2747953.1 thioredoxin-dependent thiol peroxidase [Bacteroidales bacterium]